MINQLVNFKQSQISLCEDREQDLNKELVKLSQKIEADRLIHENLFQEKLAIENEVLASKERTDLRNLENIKLNKIVEEMNSQLEDLKEQLGLKCQKNLKIKDLHEMTVLIKNYRKKQVY